MNFPAIQISLITHALRNDGTEQNIKWIDENGTEYRYYNVR